MHLPDAVTFTPAPPGAHRAVCVAFIDLGTQKDSFAGKVVINRKVRLRWELVDEKMDDGNPFTISQRYTWSMNERSNLRKALESWRGKPFEKGDFGPNGFDTRKLMGAPCLLTIVHREGNNGIRANVAAISPLPKGMEKPTVWKGPVVYIALERGEFDADAFKLLHANTQEQIKISPEYQRLMGKHVSDALTSHAGTGVADDDMDDDIPF
jgi:hypothetical protein